MLMLSSETQASTTAGQPAGNSSAESPGDDTVHISVGAPAACGRGRHAVIANAIVADAKRQFLMESSR